MKKKITFCLLMFVTLINAQTITFKGCSSLFDDHEYVFTKTGTDGTCRNIFTTTPVDGAQECGGIGTCEFKIQWNTVENRWEFLADDGNGGFTATLLMYYNTTASFPNPPGLTLGNWIENTSVTLSTCSGNLSPFNATMTLNAMAVDQVFCGSKTVADLVAYGTGIQWYLVETGGTALASTTALVNGTTYYASETLNGCASVRTGIVVTVNTIAIPTATAQTFSQSVTVANLVATGTNLKWYDVATGGTALASTTAITTGTYYVTQTENSCESDRTSVAVTVNIIPPSISYTTPVTYYTTGTPISPLTPTNTGGAVVYTGNIVSTYAGINGTQGNINGPASSATFGLIADLVADAAGNVYAADQTNSKIRKISTDGTVTTFAGGGSYGADGTGAAAGFYNLYGMTIDAVGNLYVNDKNQTGDGMVIRKITPAGVVTTLAGHRGSVGFLDGEGAAASLMSSRAIAVDPAGNVFTAQSNNIRKITPAGLVSSIALTDINGSAIINFVAADLAFDSHGNLFSTANTMNVIQKITPTGVVTTFAGNSTAGHDNGIGTTASFKNPFRMAIDAQNNIFISDFGNFLIRKITSGGVVSTYAGTALTQGTSNGPADTATFKNPLGIALDAAGNIFVGEYNSYFIRKIAAAGSYTVSPSLPAGLSMDAATGVISGTPTVASAATDYVVTTSNAGGSNSFTTNIHVIACNVALTTASQTNISCHGGSDGAATVNAATGGTAPYTYHWTSGALTAVGTTSVTGLSIGTWTCTVTDANGCSATHNFTITQPAVVALPTASAQTVLQGATVANLVATGTNLKWYAAATGGTALASTTAIATGTYYVSQTLNSCESDRTAVAVTVVIPVTPPTMTGSGTATSNSCSGTGSIAVNLATGATPYHLVNSDLSSLPTGAVVGGVGYTPAFTSGQYHYLQLTPNSNDTKGFITFLETALKPVAFSANFNLWIGGGSGADGTSFNYGKVNTSNNNYSEGGMIDNGLAIGFQEYANKIKVYYNNVELQSYNVNGSINNSGWKSVSIQVTTSGQLTLAYGGNTYCTNYQLPSAYVTDNKTNWQYGFAARCGGLNNYHSINDVVISDHTPMQYSVDGTNYTTNSTFSNLNAGTYDLYARIGDAAYNSHVFNSTTHLGSATITASPVIATITANSPTTCTTDGATIAISNITQNTTPYDLVNVSLTNQQLGTATIGDLGSGGGPYWANAGLGLTTYNTSNKSGYIAFATTVAQPNAFSAYYDKYIGGGTGGDGMSFNYGVLNTAGTAGPAQTGMVNSGLAIGFSELNNTIKIFYNKTELQSYNVNVNTNDFKSVAITVTHDGKLTIVHGGVTICSNYQLPAAYATDSKSNWHYAIAARSGNLHNGHVVKNVVIKDNSIQYTINGQYYTENPTFTNVFPGTYNVRARISNGAHCAAVGSLGSVTITPLLQGMVTITQQPATTNQTVAQNATATTLSVTATGEGTLSYQWFSNTSAINNGGNPIHGAISASYTPATSAAGTLYYYCVVSNACSQENSTISGSVTTFACNILLTPASQTNISCHGGSDGSATVNAAIGGTAPFTYHWTSGTLTAVGTTSVTGLSAGTWTCTVTDANGCSASRNFTITQPAAIASPTASAQTVLQGATVASLVATGTNLKWYAAATGGTALAVTTAIATGTYYVSQTDTSCESESGRTAVVVTVLVPVTPPTMTGSGTATNDICSGTGSIAVNLATGATPYNLVNSDLSSLPLGAVVGGQNWTPTFTSGNPHYVTLTPANNDKRGFITFLETALKPVAFNATFGLYVGNGNGADGTSFNYGKINTSNNGYGETGMIDSGLAIGFNDFANKIIIYYNKNEIQSYNVNGSLNNSGWKSVSLSVNTSGQLTLVYGGNTYCTNYQLPAAYLTDAKTNWQYGFAARCGGLNNLHAINDVVISDHTPMQYSVENNYYFTGNLFSSLIPGTYEVYARIGDAAYNSHGFNSTTHLGSATIASVLVAATVTPTSLASCTTEGGTITISNITNNAAPYDLVNVSLTNQQLGGASIGNLGSGPNPFWGNGDLVLTPNSSNKSGYIAFATTVAQPNAFSANYDVFVGGGSGGDGLSFNYGVLNTAGTAGAAETGMVNSGLAIGFSDYSNTIKIFYNKIELHSYSANVNAGGYKSVAITVTLDGKLTIVHGGITICSNYQLPAAYATDNKSNWHYALAARNGGANNYHSVKNVVIKDNSIQYTINGQYYTENPHFTNVSPGTYNVRARISNGVHCAAVGSLGSVTIATPPGSVAITEQPSTTNQSVALNAAATALSVTATGEATVSYQWYSNTTASNTNGSSIANATNASYTPPTSAAGTLYYYCVVSNACSQINSAISGSVTSYVVPPNISYTTPVTYNVGTPIAPLTPTNTGGAVTSSGNVVSTYAGINGTSGTANGPVASATFNSTHAMVADAAGNVYVADMMSSIRKISTNGMVNTFASGFSLIMDITIDTVGNLYVVDGSFMAGSSIIKKITPAGVVTTLAGHANSNGSIDGMGAAASISNSRGIVVDSSSNVFVAETDTYKIRKITPAGLASTLALTDANGSPVNLVYPSDLAIDSNGNLFTTVANYHFIQKITPAGVVTTFAGNTSSSGYTNGIGTAASFRSPNRMVIDAQNTIFVADTGNSLIRKITPSAVVSTYAGITSTPGTINGPVASATFTSPGGIALDAAGNIFVGDQNYIIRKIAAGGGYAISPALPAGLSMDATTGIISGTPTVASAATDYVVTVSNAGGSSSFTINIRIISCNVALTIASQTNIACHGGSTGLATVATTGGTAPYTYHWTSGTLTAVGTTSVTGLSAGTWTCTVTDANGCSASRNFTITQPTALALTSASQTNVACYGASTGAATVNAATGGTAPYTYHWSSGTLTAVGTTSATGLSAGTWTCTVTDANSCTATKDFTITQPTIQLGNVITETACGSYTWNGQTYTTSGEYLHQNAVSVSNTYCAASTNTNGCNNGSDEYISNVTIGTINKTSLCGNTSNYNDFTSHATAVVAGSSYPISVTNPHSYYDDAVKVWADWNQDGDFDDSGEEYALNYSHGGSNGLGTGTIAVPVGASNGNVRMRVRINYVDPDEQNQTLPCGNSQYGEIEDYTLVVSGGVTPVSTCTTYDKLILTINAIPAAPSASAQTLATGATVANLVATGTALQWYNVATGGTALTTSTSLVTGTYYVSQTLNGCESARTMVAVIVAPSIAIWNGSTWINPNLLSSTNPAIIEGNFSPSTNFEVGPLTIRNNAVMNIDSGKNLTVNGSLTVETGSSLILDNNANLLQTTEAVNTGSITIKRNTPTLKLLDYVMWSSPVTGQQLQSFSPATLSNRFYTYNPVNNLYSPVTNLSTTSFATGKGYLIRMPNNHPTTPTLWTGIFSGVPKNGTVSVPVTTGTYNAVGNPYPSTFDADTFIDDNGITEALYFWRKTNNSANPSYASYTKAGGIGTANAGDPLGLIPNGIIQVGQGFIVKSTSSAINFTNSMRTANNDNLFLRTVVPNKSRIWLNLTKASGFFSQTMVAYMNGATSGIDAAIDGRYFNDCQTALTSIINNQEYSIQGRSLPFDTSDVVPLGFKTETAGEFQIAIDHTDGLFANGQTVYLKDNLLNVVHNLSSSAYAFSSIAGVNNSRFELIYQNALGIDDADVLSNQVLVYKQDDSIKIDAGSIIMAGVKVYDLWGRLLFENKNVNANQFVFSIDAAKNVLLIKITSDEGKVIVKKIIN